MLNEEDALGNEAHCDNLLTRAFDLAGNHFDEELYYNRDHYGILETGMRLSRSDFQCSQTKTQNWRRTSPF